MLREMIENTGIQPEKVAALLGYNPEIFQQWLVNQRPMPQSVLQALSDVIGSNLEPYLERKISTKDAGAVTPAIWYRFRGEGLVEADREFVFLIRRLGYFLNELEEITGARSVGWKSLFQEIRQKVDIQAPPRVQGIQAARMFRESRGLSTGATGIGEALRGNLKAMGVLVVESPIPESRLEGCCFYVGTRPTERPCVFANSHHSTWFRRNMVLLHEIAHAIFDAETEGATLDFFDGSHAALCEERADAFAQEALVPRNTLAHVAQRQGFNWASLSSGQLAAICAECHTEKRTVLRAALEAGLISQEVHDQYAKIDIGALLRAITEHALSTDEYIRNNGESAAAWLGKRESTVPSRKIRLPVTYIKTVLEALGNSCISRGKAAEMLFVDSDVFRERFGEGQEDFLEKAGELAF
jgi:Zn-dependent peptidase ImmA (M78 family)